MEGHRITPLVIAFGGLGEAAVPPADPWVPWSSAPDTFGAVHSMCDSAVVSDGVHTWDTAMFLGVFLLFASSILFVTDL